VVGPLAGILAHPAAELAEGQQRHPVGLAGDQVGVERSLPLDGQDQATDVRSRSPCCQVVPSVSASRSTTARNWRYESLWSDRLSLGTASKAACNRLSSRWSIKTADRATSR
jgi:hypothetical protein